MHQIQKDKFHVISPEAFSPKPLNEDQQRLYRALAMLRGGACWVKGDGTSKCPNIQGKFCVLEAVTSVAPGFEGHGANRSLARAAEERGFRSAYALNDHHATTFADIESLFARAIELAA